MGSGRLPAARVVRKQKEKWGGRPQQPHDAAHARTQVRALHRHVAWQDQVRRAVLGPFLLHVRSSRVRRPPTLVPPGGRPLLPRHHLLLPLLPLLSRATQQAGRQLADGGVLVHSRRYLCLLHPFVAMLVNFSEREDEDWQYWIDANIAAGVFGLLNDVFYGLGAYLIYVEWKANPTGAPAPPPA